MKSLQPDKGSLFLFPTLLITTLKSKVVSRYWYIPPGWVNRHKSRFDPTTLVPFDFFCFSGKAEYFFWKIKTMLSRRQKPPLQTYARNSLIQVATPRFLVEYHFRLMLNYRPQCTPQKLELCSWLWFPDSHVQKDQPPGMGLNQRPTAMHFVIDRSRHRYPMDHLSIV